MTHPLTLLESPKFAVEKLNPLCLAEGNAKRPIYRMHKWWARRLSTVFRAILLALFLAPDEEDLFWEYFEKGASLLHGKVILDPFMGGGTTLVEALRLGARVVGVDINPVAWFISKKEVEAVSLEELQQTFEQLEHEVGEQIQALYRTTCPKGHEAEGMYFFWVKVAPCLKCGHEIELFPNYELARYSDRYVSVCPTCHQVIETQGYSSTTTCPSCGTTFDPKQGVVSRGVYHCSSCGHASRIVDAVAYTGGPLPTRLIGVEGYCPTCNARFYKRADEQDLARWEEARKLHHQAKEQGLLLLPDEEIPVEGRSDPRPVNHGYRYYKDLFNERQQLALSWLLRAILRIPNRNVREFFLLAFSDCLDSNNMLCKYESGWHKISKMFGFHAYHPIERPTENNVWGGKYGRGTFRRCFQKVLRGKTYTLHPYQRLQTSGGTWKNQPSRGERGDGPLATDFQHLLHLSQGSLLRCQSAADLSFLPSDSIDAVVTDPPYFDNVMYSELADFFYVWLRLGLREDYPQFHPPHVFRQEEIIQNERRGRSAAKFAQMLRTVFQESARALKPGGPFVFTFHHRKLEAWALMAEVLGKAGFYISAAPIIRSEGKSGFHSSKGNVRYDAIFVCRSWEQRPYQWSESESLAFATEMTQQWIERTLQSGMALSSADKETILYSQAVQAYLYTLSSFTEASSLQAANFLSKALLAFRDQFFEEKAPLLKVKTC